VKRLPCVPEPGIHNAGVSRRGFLAAGAFTALGVWSGLAHAGSYLDRAALLVFVANSEMDFLRRKLYDGELARLVHQQTEARTRAAASMMVPPDVVQAHPHLLLMLENCERAASSAVERKAPEFLKFLTLARDEEQLFRSILKQLGWELPSVR
jgi:hypothetical protein